MRRSLVFMTILMMSMDGWPQSADVVRLGIFTDCQYCNCPTEGKRNYALSLSKLDSCISEFNSQRLDGVFHLGDMIDHGYESYDSILPRFSKFTAPFNFVLGNHDYMIKSKYKAGLLDVIGMPKAYYRKDFGLWTVLVLNGNDLSYFGPQTRQQRQERNDMVAGLLSGLQPNGMPWNGGIGQIQMQWLEEQLSDAQHTGRMVVVICHFPLYSKGNHNLFNNHALFAGMNKYSCVKAYFSGHFHAGYYHVMDGMHLVNFKGMVDTQENSFAVVTLTSDSILIKGYGREPDRSLKFRK